MNGSVEFVFVVAVINGVVAIIIFGFPAWALKRWVDRNDEKQEELRAEVARLKDGRVAGLEENVRKHEELDDERHRAAAMARRDMHEKLSCLDRDTVKWPQFQGLSDRYVSATQELARVSERVDMSSRRNEQIFDRMISMKGDLEHTIAHVEAMRKATES